METIYVHLDARKVRVGDMASGGEDHGGTYRYAVIPRAPKPPREEPGEKILDFEACRRKLEGAAEPEGSALGEAAAPACSPAERRPRRAGLLLDLCATAAILLFAVVASVRFLAVF